MKISFVIILAAVFCSFTENAVSQNARVSINARNVPVGELLTLIESQTDYLFVYSKNNVDVNRKVSIQSKEEPVAQVLNSVFQNTDVRYAMEGTHIILVPKDRIREMEVQQSIPITGTITDEAGEPMPGVNVLVKGTVTGVVSDMEGKFRINIPSKNAVLVFSFIGYITQEIPVSDRTDFSIMLEEDTRKIEEVVVVGYGRQRKIETTGSIASVKTNELNQTPIANIAQGIQSRVAGVMINQNSGAPGGNISVRVRGTNSISGTSEPLYVIDGIQISNSGGVNELSPLSTINPSDIESIEILKDASASAIYGARAANGVILIPTKRGKAGASRVSIEGYYGVQQVTKTLDVLNSAEFAQLENEVFKDNYYKDPSSLTKSTNWQDIIFRNAPIQNYQLSIDGGGEKTQLAFSANYFNQEGIIINSRFERYSFRLNADHRVNKWFKVGASVLGSYSINKGIDAGTEVIGDAGVVTQTVLGAAIGAPPFLEPYREDGSIYPFGEQGNGRYREVTNPLNFSAILRNRAIKRTMGNFFGEFDILPGLTYRASFNADIESRLVDYYSPLSIIQTSDIKETSGEAKKTNQNWLNLLHESILTYSTKFAEDHSLKVTGVFATQVDNYNMNEVTVKGFPNDATKNEALQLGLGTTPNSDRNKQRLDSYMGRINYGFRDKYFLDLTMRVDGSSKFGANHKYGFFPAVSAAWRVIEESFMNNVTWVSDLKLRASFGVTGNAGAITPYNSLATVGSSGSYNINHAYTTGVAPSRIPNPDLRWEKSTQTDIGLDVSFLNGHLSLVADYYFKKTDDLLYVKTLPLSSGYGSITGNFGSLENKGLELAVNAVLIDNRTLVWTVNGNISFNRNKLTSLDGGTTLEKFTANNFSVMKVGEPLGVFKTYVFDGINQTGEAIVPGYDGRTGGHKVKT